MPDKCGQCDHYPWCGVPGNGCIECQGIETPAWNHDFYAAAFLYRKITALSMHDMNGFPTLEKLEFVMKHEDMEIDNKQAFMDYLIEIHMNTIKVLSEKK